MSGGRHRATLRDRAPAMGRRVSSRRSRQAMVVTGLASTALLAGVGGAGTFAFWTDTQQLEGAAFSSGTLDLQVAGSSATYAWNDLGLVNAAPGESVSSAVELRDVGTTPFTLSISGAATGALSPFATVTVKTGATPSADDTTYPRQETCNGGTQHFSGSLTSTSTQLSSLPAPSPGSPRTLCVVVSLPTTADNAAQGKTMRPTLTLNAQQVLP
ncbi:SipW-dependent-type signal peptide-containing protein [Nocardioidaceae bacterium]|nr:SipW-dependent-type signal peptide-containing protein [Nocardioidaceae bacterium]